MVDVAIIGGGPAGMAAACAAAAGDASVVVIEASSRLGGQYLRQPLFDAPGGGPVAPSGLPARVGRLADAGRVQVKLETSVWSITRDPGEFSLRLDDPQATQLRAKAVVLATGAPELVLPFPGWDLPGVVTAGAAQALLKAQHLRVGERVVVAGTGPLLLPVAAALAGRGASVLLVEAAPAHVAIRLAPALAIQPAKLAEAAGYFAALLRHRVKVLSGHAVVRCEGTSAVERAVIARIDANWRPVPGSERTVDLDALCVSYGFVPRLELARQLSVAQVDHGGPLRISVDGDPSTMESSLPGVFVAGELAGIGGARVAQLQGELAGRAAARFARPAQKAPAAAPARQLAQLRRARAFAAALERSYRLGDGWLSWLENSTVFCRCEQSRWGELLAAIKDGATTVRELRSLTRCGMGYCQGRTCGPALQLAIAATTGRSLQEAGDLHRRPVAVPVPLAQIARQGDPSVG